MSDLSKNNAPTNVFRAAIEQAISQVGLPHFKIHVPRRLDLFNPVHPGHFHPDFEIFLPRQGVCRFTCPGSRFELGPDSLCLMPPGVSHREVIVGDRDPFETVVVCFRSETLTFLHCGRGAKRAVSAHGARHLETTWSLEMNQQLNAAVRAHEEAGGAPSPYVLALVRAVLLRMSDVWKQSSEPPLSRHPLIGAVREHVRYSLSDSRLQVRGIAKALQCHPDYLSRLFHQETGTPLKVYIRAERIRAARQMLAYGTLSVKQIAFACGFQQSAYFIRVFKEVTGSTPRRLALNMTSSRPFLLPSR